MIDKLNDSIPNPETMTYEAPEVLELGSGEELIQGTHIGIYWDFQAGFRWCC